MSNNKGLSPDAIATGIGLAAVIGAKRNKQKRKEKEQEQERMNELLPERMISTIRDMSESKKLDFFKDLAKSLNRRDLESCATEMNKELNGYKEYTQSQLMSRTDNFSG